MRAPFSDFGRSSASSASAAWRRFSPTTMRSTKLLASRRIGFSAFCASTRPGHNEPLLGGGDVVPRPLDGIDVHRDRVDAPRDELFGVVRVDRRSLAADRAGDAKPPAD